MKVAVLGAGVIGTTAAYYLALQGHEVTVLERQAGPARETSFANAGELCPGYAAPWAAPGVPLKALKWLLMRHSPLVIHPQADAAQWRWLAAMLRNCTAARYQVNRARMQRLANYSAACMKELRAATGLRYDERMRGTLQLLRTQQQVDAAAHDMAALRGYGVHSALLDCAGMLRHEPALAARAHRLAGALYLPGDETGDCHAFTTALAALAQGQGVGFRYGVDILRLRGDAHGVTGVDTSQGQVLADRILVALGSHSPAAVAPLGLRLPVYPVKGYSITVPVTDDAQAPQSTVMDDTHKVAVTRLGSRIRVGGTAQLSGFDMRLPEARQRTLAFVLGDLFPHGGDLARAEFWTGLRPMTPDGTPILGPTPIGGLWLATGHGTLGWTLAAGTGRLLADWMSGRQPEVDTEGLTLMRYGR